MFTVLSVINAKLNVLENAPEPRNLEAIAVLKQLQLDLPPYSDWNQRSDQEAPANELLDVVLQRMDPDSGTVDRQIVRSVRVHYPNHNQASPVYVRGDHDTVIDEGDDVGDYFGGETAIEIGGWYVVAWARALVIFPATAHSEP